MGKSVSSLGIAAIVMIIVDIVFVVISHSNSFC